MNRIIPVALFVLLVTLPACRQKETAGPYSETRFLMDTIVTITLYTADSPQDSFAAAADQAFQAMAAVERIASAHLPESELSLLNRAAEPLVRVSPQLGRLLSAAFEIAEISGGAFDPALGRVKSLWPFGEAGPRPPDSAAVRRALEYSGRGRATLSGRTVRLEKTGIAFDLGGIAKGWAVDTAAAVLRGHGITAGIIDAGGDLTIFGTHPSRPEWNIGIRHPSDPGELFGVLSTRAASVATSGDYERFFISDGIRYHHLLDPATGFPASAGVTSVTIVTDSALRADALATAVFIMGRRKGMEFIEADPAAEGVIIFKTSSGPDCSVSSGLKDSFRAGP